MLLRRAQLFAVAAVIVVGAFSTGADFLFFLVYLGILVVGGSYVVTRYGLSDLEAGYTLDRLHAEVGESLRATYTIRNAGRMPKLWLEAYNRSDLPVPIPGRALALGGRSDRSWTAHVPLVRRGQFRIEPLVIRTGDPFGFFEASASVGAGAELTVYPRLELLPRWRLPAASLEGTQSRPERTIQTTPLVTSIRPYAPGDAYNRIHWPSSARHQELYVKEFDLEQTADVAIFLDLERVVQAGEGDESTVEAGVRAAASIGGKALIENRAVALTASGAHLVTLPADRGGRQHQKMMRLLAVVQGDGTLPLVEVLVQMLPRLRRGTTAVVITPSLERSWVRLLGGLSARGVGCVVCLPDPVAYEEHARRERNERRLPEGVLAERRRAERAIRYSLAEHEIPVHPIVPGRPLGELLVTAGAVTQAVPR